MIKTSNVDEKTKQKQSKNNQGNEKTKSLRKAAGRTFDLKEKRNKETEV